MASVRVGKEIRRPTKLGVLKERVSPFRPVEWREGQRLVEAVWRLPIHRRIVNRLLGREHPVIEALDRLYEHYRGKDHEKATFVKNLRNTLASTVEGNRLLPAEEAQMLRLALMQFHRTVEEHGVLKKPPETWPFERLWEHLETIDRILTRMAEKRAKGII